MIYMKKYKYLGRSQKDSFCIKGVDLFLKKWQTVGDCAIVVDPETKNTYDFSVYSVETGDKGIHFAAGKNKQGEWLFFDAE